MIKIGKFNVRIVKPGDRYGMDDCLVNAGPAWLVEFYDTTYRSPFSMGRGQFVSRYFTATILASDYPNGLCLDGDFKDVWSVTADGMKQVQDFIRKEAA